jgi:hypothetical protein
MQSCRGHWALTRRRRSSEAARSRADEHGQRCAKEGSARILVHANGDGGPNAKQRASLRHLRDLELRIAIVSDSYVVRAIVTAISWVLKQQARRASELDTEDARGRRDEHRAVQAPSWPATVACRQCCT